MRLLSHGPEPCASAIPPFLHASDILSVFSSSVNSFLSNCSVIFFNFFIYFFSFCPVNHFNAHSSIVIGTFPWIYLRFVNRPVFTVYFRMPFSACPSVPNVIQDEFPGVAGRFQIFLLHRILFISIDLQKNHF